MKGSQRFKGLKLSAADRRELRRRGGAGHRFTARIWRRMQTLLLLDRGMTLTAAAAALISAAVLAGYVPARHASRIDPMVTLRHDLPGCSGVSTRNYYYSVAVPA